MRPSTAWQALARRGFLASAWPWRALVYLASSSVTGAPGLVLIVALLAVGGALSTVLIGIPLLLALGLAGVPMAVIERRRLWIIDQDPADDPHKEPDRPGLLAWLDTRFHEPATWRELGYTVTLVTLLWPVDLLALMAGVSVPFGLLFLPAELAISGPGSKIEVLPFWRITTVPQAWLAVPAGVVALVVTPYLLTALAGAQGALARLLLAPREEELGARLVELTRSRARLVDAFEAERRRIERDLHDGAQQRLVALSMTLGLARLSTGAEAAELVVAAHEQSKLALDDLRDLTHGIHPQVLTDRGLPAAVAEAADRSPVPVDVNIDLPRRLPGPVEAAAYFMVCEALANVAKHSQAKRASVEGRLEADRLVVEISDDGTGGADAARGTGLAGLADRIAVVGGRMMLSSPPGGPTLLRVEIPCAEPESA